ncbi:Transmembrane protein 97- predicted [Striga hermonthica]|uniref:Transmembrane protein 97- predicted n=1 Tax=Striga hermonthica TaxID=68872 RepID=A0A9N7MVF7_STRHE|nr:Transmembrane protein 97- predicted [Striga hermonthica]
MGALCKLVDAALFVFFLFIAVVAPLIDGQTCLPEHLFPPFLLELKRSYAQEYGDYLVAEKPHFFIGIVWLELIFQWPLAVASVYGIVAGKSWLGTACLLYGASTLTSMVAILAELSLSNRASDQLLMMYYPFLGCALLALLRGLLANSGKNAAVGKRSVPHRKKRA